MTKLYGYGLALLAGLLFIAGIFFKGESVGRKSEEVKNNRLKLKEKQIEIEAHKENKKRVQTIKKHNRTINRKQLFAGLRKHANKDSD